MTEYYHVVPWCNTAEWNDVYEQLFSDLCNKENVLKQLLIWKARCPSLPSGIESTLTLLQVYVQHQHSSNDIVTDKILRLAYSSAVMRFVNHMLDTETAKSGSLYQAAKNLGVPDWIIDLRHDTAHSNNLPSLQLLKEATLIGLEWLKKNYWEKHRPYVQDYMSGQEEESTNDENRIAVLMNFCISLSFCAHSKCKNLSDIPNTSLRESIINDAKDLLADKIDMSNPKTVSVKALINNIINLQSKRLLKTKNTVHYVNKVLLGEDSLFLSYKLFRFMQNKGLGKGNKKLRASYVQCFEVLLTFLHSNDLLLDFILALIKITQAGHDDKLMVRLAAAWLSEILSALRRCRAFNIRLNEVQDKDITSKKRDELKLLFRHWFPSETSHLMLDLKKPVPIELTDINYIKPIISSYNPYLTYFVKDLLNLIEPELPAGVTGKVCKLAKLISTPHKFPKQPTTRIYTEDDLRSSQEISYTVSEDSEVDCMNKSEVHVDNRGLLNSIWRIAPRQHSWGTCPIGQLPWEQKNTVSNIEDMEIDV